MLETVLSDAPVLCRYAGKVLLRPLAPHTLYHARVAAANSYGLRCVM